MLATRNTKIVENGANRNDGVSSQAHVCRDSDDAHAFTSVVVRDAMDRRKNDFAARITVVILGQF